MGKNLPSMQALLAFEAAARHLSFTRAAHELNLTQAAISHQIKNLEHLLGVKLFIRQPNALALTSAARDYLHSISEALNLISSATGITRKSRQSTTLIIVCLPTYATQCLIPVLPEFQHLHPHVTINLLLRSEFAEFDRANYDVAIRYGSGRWNGFTSALLYREEFFPVCAPHLIPEDTAVTEQDLLTQLPQIRTSFGSMFQDDWPAWLKAAGYSGVRFGSSSTYHMQLASLEAAAAGAGLAIGRTPLVNRLLTDRTIIAPFKTRVESESSYYLSSPIGKADQENVTLFWQWAMQRLGEAEPGSVKQVKSALSSCPTSHRADELGYRPLASLLEEWQTRSPDKYALIDVSTDQRITFSELAARVDACARQLRAIDIQRGDHVILFMADGLEKIIVWLALWRLAAVVCPVDLARLSFSSAEGVCDTLRPKCILCGAQSDTRKVPSSIASRVRMVAGLDMQGKVSSTYDIHFSNGPVDEVPLPEGAKSHDVAAICSTSGTTGEPKLIVYDHATYWLNGQAIIERLGLGANDRMLEYRSFDWSSAQILSLVPFLQSGLTLHIAPQFSLSSFSKWVADYQLSISVGVPAVINLLLQKPENICLSDLSSLRYITCSTALLPISQWIRFEQIFRLRILNIYGSSEAGWICSHRSDYKQIGTVGEPMPSVRVDVLDDQGHPCARGVTGHVMVQGPAVARGLLRADGNIEAFRNKRLATNDLGFIDQSGQVHITGRVDDVIIRGGVKIYPRDIEDVLLAHPEVQDVAVIGTDDDIYGQSPSAFFIPRSKVSEDELLAYCRRNLPREAIPKNMIRMEKFPRNPRGKLLRSTLLKLWRAEISNR